jgi:hypothetical protein
MQSEVPETRYENSESPDDTNHDKHASEVIDILAWSARYRWSKNSNAFEKKLVWTLRWVMPVEIASAVVFSAMRTLADRHRLNLDSGFWAATFDVITWVGMATGGLIVVSMLWLLWLRRKFLVQDQGRHIQKAYVLHATQVRILGSYPVTVLEGVSRFYERRPFVVQGLYSTLFGGGTLTLASVGVLFGLVKGFLDLRALGPAGGDFQVDLWMGLAVVLLIAAIERWVRARGDHARGLLTEAIVLAAIREGGVNYTRPPGPVT